MAEQAQKQQRGAAPQLALFLGRAVEDDADFFEGDEAAIHHFVEAGKDFFDALGGLDDLENDGQVLRETKDFVGVIDARPAITRDAAKNGCARKAFFAQHFDNRFVERPAVPFIGFADVNAHQRAFAFKFLVRHRDPVTGDS